MKILVTGAAGFIGAFTSKKLVEMGHEVIGVDNLNDYYDVALKHGRLGWLEPLSGFQFKPHHGTWSAQNGQTTLSKMSDALDCSRSATMKMFKEFDACYSSFTMSSGWQPQ